MSTRATAGRLWGGCLAVAVLLTAAPAALALDESGVLVLYNASSADGSLIANHYAQVHPGVTLWALNNVPLTEDITWDVYLNTIRPQVLSALDASAATIDCIVTTKGLPLRITNPVQPGPTSWNAYSSLESELTRVDTINSRTLMGNQAYFLPAMWGGNPLAQNPYFRKDAAFSHDAYGIRLTSRLDATTAGDVMDAIDRAQNAVMYAPGYTMLLDDDLNAPASASDRMELLRDKVLAPRGISTVYDGTDAFIGDSNRPVIGYVSHGIYGGAPSRYTANGALAFDLADGAVFHSWESFNAYSFDANSSGRLGQGQVAEWIALGGTAGVGNVEEPGANPAGVANEDRMFQMLLDGYTWAEAAWNSITQLSFVNTVVGDPLMVWNSELLPGDADLSGTVDVHDLIAWNNNRMQPGKVWAEGDFNFDGWTDVHDLIIWNANKFQTYQNPTIPEPTCLGLLGVGLAALLRRRM